MSEQTTATDEQESERTQFMRWWNTFAHDVGDEEAASYAAWCAWLRRGQLAQSETRQCDGCVIRDSTIANLHREGATKADIIDALEAADADLRSHNTRQSTLNNISRLLHIMATDRHSADDEEAEAAERAREACIGANLPANWKP